MPAEYTIETLDSRYPRDLSTLLLRLAPYLRQSAAEIGATHPLWSRVDDLLNDMDELQQDLDNLPPELTTAEEINAKLAEFSESRRQAELEQQALAEVAKVSRNRLAPASG
jgi:hypothetical protein